MEEKNIILTTSPQKDYELLDSGDGEKLERFGAVLLRRPDPQAMWGKSLGEAEWEKADAAFPKNSKQWRKKEGFPESWNVGLGDLTFSISLSTFKHTGVFPEQLSNWQWINESISKAHKDVQVLNLFGYTGGATLAAAKAGAKVTHVDGSKTAIAKAKENAELSGLGDKPIRWMLDDALAFVKREVRRGTKYEAIIMDPPSYGHGPKKELWRIEEHLKELLSECKKILSDDPVFVLINGYASGFSGVAYRNLILELLSKKEGRLEFGELSITETKGERILPAGIFARWCK